MDPRPRLDRIENTVPSMADSVRLNLIEIPIGLMPLGMLPVLAYLDPFLAAFSASFSSARAPERMSCIP